MSEDMVDHNGTDEAQDKKAKKAAKHDGGVADLERVTDYAEEKEISSADISNVSVTTQAGRLCLIGAAPIKC